VKHNINSSERKKAHDSRNYHRTQMQKEMVIRKLKEKGCRITKQRMILLDIILEEECSCCKEIYYKASLIDNEIGSATVYRMINTLEVIGAISRKNLYKIACSKECGIEDACTVELNDNTVYYLSAKKWYAVIQAGLKACGYINDQSIRAVTVKQCECDGLY
jgi:Fur family transcriptional regulator, ferric uptake regulator